MSKFMHDYMMHEQTKQSTHQLVQMLKVQLNKLLHVQRFCQKAILKAALPKAPNLQQLIQRASLEQALATSFLP